MVFTYSIFSVAPVTEPFFFASTSADIKLNEISAPLSGGSKGIQRTFKYGQSTLHGGSNNYQSNGG